MLDHRPADAEAPAFGRDMHAPILARLRPRAARPGISVTWKVPTRAPAALGDRAHCPCSPQSRRRLRRSRSCASAPDLPSGVIVCVAAPSMMSSTMPRISLAPGAADRDLGGGQRLCEVMSIGLRLGQAPLIGEEALRHQQRVGGVVARRRSGAALQESPCAP